MTFHEATSNRIRRAIQRQGRTQEEVAFSAGIEPRTLRRLLAGDSLNANTVERVSDVLGISWFWR